MKASVGGNGGEYKESQDIEEENERKEGDLWCDYRLTLVCNVFQMGSYFGHAVAATDINNDG